MIVRIFGYFMELYKRKIITRINPHFHMNQPVTNAGLLTKCGTPLVYIWGQMCQMVPFSHLRVFMPSMKQDIIVRTRRGVCKCNFILKHGYTIQQSNPFIRFLSLMDCL